MKKGRAAAPLGGCCWTGWTLSPPQRLVVVEVKPRMLWRQLYQLPVFLPHAEVLRERVLGGGGLRGISGYGSGPLKRSGILGLLCEIFYKHRAQQTIPRKGPSAEVVKSTRWVYPMTSSPSSS